MKNTAITKDLANRKLIITRDFDGPVEQVWRAWTEADLLDKWWAPRPWRAETKTMDFSEGGFWLYCMIGPDGTGAWCRVDFKMIDPLHSFTSVVGFSDEGGNFTLDFPKMYWNTEFSGEGSTSKINVVISFDSESDLNKILEMGFEAGFTAGLTNLDKLLAQ